MKRTFMYRMQGGSLGLMVSMLLALVSLMPAKAGAENGGSSEKEVLLDKATGLKYTKAGAIVGIDFGAAFEGRQFHLVIPDSIDGVAITQIGDGEHSIFSENPITNSLTFARSKAEVTIKNHAMGGYRMDSLTIGSSVTTIEAGAFEALDLKSFLAFEKENPQTYEQGVGYSPEMFGANMNGIVELVAPSQESVKSYLALTQAYGYASVYPKGSDVTDTSVRRGGITYQLNPATHTATVVSTCKSYCYYGSGYDKYSILPEVEANGEKYTVTAIAPEVFKGVTLKYHFLIPKSVTTIGSQAFGSLHAEYLDEAKIIFEYDGSDLSGYASDMLAGYQGDEQLNVAVPEKNGKEYEELFKDDDGVDVYITHSAKVDLTDDNPDFEKGYYPFGGITYTRQLTEEEQKGYVNVCLPFAVSSFTEPFISQVEEVYSLDSVVVKQDNGDYRLNFKKEEMFVSQNEPLLLKVKEGVTELKFTCCSNCPVTADAYASWKKVKDEAGNLVGNVEVEAHGEYTWDDLTSFYLSECYYTMNTDGSVTQLENKKIVPFRSYIFACNMDDGAFIPDHKFRFVSNLNPGGPSTGISDVNIASGQANQAAKSAIYSIDGKLVRHAGSTMLGLPKGLYIQNGKKVVVK